MFDWDENITEINNKINIPSTLHDGIFIGEWIGYSIKIKIKHKTYDFKTENGIRGVSKIVLIKKDNKCKFIELNN